MHLHIYVQSRFLSLHLRKTAPMVEEHPVSFVLQFYSPSSSSSSLVLFVVLLSDSFFLFFVSFRRRDARRDRGGEEIPAWYFARYRDRIYIGDIILDDVVIRYAGIHDAAFDVNCEERRSRFCFIPRPFLFRDRSNDVQICVPPGVARHPTRLLLHICICMYIRGS